jgi:RimJ/RimL family protein N-acetyltransferase
MEPVVLTDDHVVLSRAIQADVDVITLACQDPEVAAWVTIPSPYSRADAEGFVANVVGPGWESGQNLTWAIRGTDGGLLGMIGLHGVAAGSAEIGFWVAPWARRQGAVTRAVSLVLDFAFSRQRLDLVRVSWLAYVGNWPSRRVAWRAGFRVEGTIRLEAIQRGVRRDSWWERCYVTTPANRRSPGPRRHRTRYARSHLWSGRRWRHERDRDHPP